jgi:hypothetical protein
MLYRDFAPLILAHRDFGPRENYRRRTFMGVWSFVFRPHRGHLRKTHFLPPAWVCRTEEGERERKPSAHKHKWSKQ